MLRFAFGLGVIGVFTACAVAASVVSSAKESSRRRTLGWLDETAVDETAVD